MLSFCLNLSSYRLKIVLSKRRNLHRKKGFWETLKNIRSGSRFSRLFRYLFEKRKIKTILGSNLALLALTISIFSPRVSAFSAISKTEIVALPSDRTELTTKTGFRFPLEKIKITQGYHSFHQAIDLDGLTGDRVYPIAEGKIEAVIFDRFALGNHIVINHGSGLKSVYAHLSKIEVFEGEEVKTDQVIGRVGSSGTTFGDHLHLEILENNHRVNPLTILSVK